MNVGVLIITHNRIGAELLDTANRMLGKCPLAANVLSVAPNCDPDALVQRAQLLLESLDQGDGVLIMTDVYGSTPGNIARDLHPRNDLRIVSGINLPMLVRVLNYPHLSLESLVEKAVSGGQNAILPCPAQAPAARRKEA